MEEDVQRLFNKYDSHNTGKIEYNEFVDNMINGGSKKSVSPSPDESFLNNLGKELEKKRPTSAEKIQIEKAKAAQHVYLSGLHEARGVTMETLLRDKLMQRMAGNLFEYITTCIRLSVTLTSDA